MESNPPVLRYPVQRRLPSTRLLSAMGTPESLQKGDPAYC